MIFSPTYGNASARAPESLLLNWVLGMKLVICAGPSTTGKTAVLAISFAAYKAAGCTAFLKIDVQFAEEDTKPVSSASRLARSTLANSVPTTATSWYLATPATGPEEGCGVLFVETAGLCLRCS